MRNIRWCANCNVPILGKECDICGATGQDCAKDLKPIFSNERLLLEKLLGVKLPPFIFRHRNRIISEGKTILTFKIDMMNKRLIPLYYKENEDEARGMDFREGIKQTIKANAKFLEKREKQAINFIKEISYDHPDAFVLFGGGKDSAAVAILAKKALGTVPLLFVDTTLEFPETYQFVERFSKIYNLPLMRDENGEYYRAEQDFFQLCERLGPPSIYCRWCCHIFKEQPVRRFINDHLKNHTDIMFLTGIRRNESRRRNNYTSIEPGKRVAGQTLIQPINDWSDLEVWLYTLWRGIEMNSLYELGHARVGCWPCPCTPPFMDLMRQITHANLWKKFERILSAYASENYRSKEWVEKGLWRLRRPKRQRIFINPLSVRENDNRISFVYVLPYRTTFFEFLKILGDIKTNKDGSFNIKTKHGFEVNCRVRKFDIILTIDCIKSKYIDIKDMVEEILFRSLNCIGCGACSSSCPEGALQVIKGKVTILQEKCNKCGLCLKNSCTIEDSEKMYVAKLNAFSLTPCEMGLSMNHVTFFSEDLGKKIAEKLKTRGIKVEIYDKGKIICVDANLPREKIEQLTLSVIRSIYAT
jgi:phosphoadenosine phosphosulfate reductase